MYVFFSNYTSGLVNYWPVTATSTPVFDLFTGQSMTSANPTRVADRFSTSSGAIGVRDSTTFWTLPTAVYFSGSFSVIGWLKVYTCLNNARFLDCATGPYADNIVFAYTTATNCQPYMNVFTGSTSQPRLLGSSVCPTNGSWVHLAISVTGTVAQGYMNGQPMLTNGNVNSPQSVSRTACFIGQSNFWASGDMWANADFDEIKFYNRGLSQSEVQYDFNSIRSFVGTI
jgi:hypothetical protein